jgi:predicted kinase
MRKWMRDRLQRRKKSPASTSDQPAPPPLQPAYFEAEQPSDEVDAKKSTDNEGETLAASPESESRSTEPESDRGSRSTAESTSDTQSKPSQPASRGSAQIGRARRRRGGRGRGGRGREQAVAQAFTPAAVKGSIPPLPVESAELDAAEEEAPDAGEIGTEAEAESRSAEPVAAPALKPPVPVAAAQRPPKGVVVLAIGLPGSGKSSWFKRHNVVALSSDMVRSLLFDDVREQRFQDLVFSNLRSMLKARLIAKRPTNYVDATNLTPQERQHWIKLAKDYQYEVHAVFFDVPLEVCVERHQRRDRVVPEDVMRRMAAKLKPPAFEEGFAKITVVRVKKKEPEAS